MRETRGRRALQVRAAAVPPPPRAGGAARAPSAPAVTVHAGDSAPAAGVVPARHSPSQAVSFHLVLGDNMNRVLDSSLFGVIPSAHSSERARKP